MDDKDFTLENEIVEIDAPDDEFEEETTETSAKVVDEELVVDLKKEKKKEIKKNDEPKAEEKPKKKEKTKKIKKASLWSRLSKKGKTLIIILIIIILLAALALVYFFVLRDKPEVKEEPKENVVLEKDNYIYENGKLKFLDENEDVIGTYTCKDKDTKKCYVATLSSEDTFDTPLYIDKEDNPIVKNSKIYFKNYVFVFDDGKISLYDIKSKKATGSYELIKTGDVDDDLVVVKETKGDYGIIKLSKTGASEVIANEFEYLGIYNSTEYFIARDNRGTFLIDTDGKAVTAKFGGEIKNFDENYIAVKDDKYDVYNYAGDSVLSELYDYVDFANGYVFAINGTKMFIYDKEMFRITESPIKLKSEEYRKTYIFDEENNLVDTKKAYELTFSDAEISVKLSETSTKSVNLYEYKLNKTNSFVNYYDGVLYFYNEEDKQTLIGTYNCNNKNITTADSDSFTNCFIAKEKKIINENTNGYIPIVNSNYVFIRDVKTGASEIINLYDLTAKKSKAKYSMVDTGVGSTDITAITTQNNIVYAQNTSGNYGAISFNQNGVSGLIGFKENDEGTKEIKLLGENILVKRGTTNYLYDKLGKKLATSTFEIVSYENGYVIVKNNGKYMIYTMPNGNTGSIISDELDYVKIYDKFFVGIKNKKLNIYYLTNGKDKVLTEDIEVKSNTGSSYKLTEYSDTNVIEVINSDTDIISHIFNKDWSKVEKNEE